jgi:HK97 family phage portal protein
VRTVDRYKKPSLNDFYGAQKRSTTTAANPAQWLIDAISGQTNHSGQPVNEKTALSIGAVHACVRVISEGLAAMPFKLYEVSGRDKIQDKASPAAKILSQPNPYNTWVNFIKYMGAGAIYRGNSYAYIFRDGAGNPINLLPLQNCTVTPKIGNGNLFYDIQTNDPIYNGIPKVVSNYDIIHIKGLCMSNQFTAINPIQYHAETFGIDLAAMASLSTSFKTGTKKFMLASEKGWSTDQQVATRDSMETVLRNEKIVFSVPSGVSAQSISLTPQEAGYIEAMGFTAKDIARIFGVPASIIGADDGAIKGSVEQDSLNFLNQTLNPWAVNIEAEFKMKLLSEKDKPKKFFKFNFNSLLRTDAVSRAQYFSTMVLNGIISRNEARDWEDLNPYEFGDEFMVPFNEVAASQFTAITQAKIDSMDATQQQNNNPNGNN